MRILLIGPRSEFPDVIPAWLRIPQLSLLILEALTGPEHQVSIVEEEVTSVPFEQRWDLVGITVMTATAPRSYELARRFRQSGAKVVLGGVHPSLLPDEAARHADAVVVGEAEGIWPKLVEDARHHRLESVYSNPTPRLEEIPLVRYRPRPYRFPPVFNPVLASRGCPKGCDFCCVHKVNGLRFRRLSVDRVIEQIQLRSTRDVMFLDDNLASHRGWALELFTRLIPLKLRLASQVPVSFILDEPLFAAAVAAGMKAVFVGVETIDRTALLRYRKAVSPEGYGEAIRRCREAGVLFHAALIFGMDEHDRSIFESTLDFVMQQSIPSVGPYVLTPYPGTDLYHRLVREGRVLHRNWAYYDHLTPVFEPARMSFEELATGYHWFRRQLFGTRGILRRLPAQLKVEPIAYLGLNLAFRTTTSLLEQHYQRYFQWLREHERSKRVDQTEGSALPAKTAPRANADLGSERQESGVSKAVDPPTLSEP